MVGNATNLYIVTKHVGLVGAGCAEHRAGYCKDHRGRVDWANTSLSIVTAFVRLGWGVCGALSGGGRVGECVVGWDRIRFGGAEHWRVGSVNTSFLDRDCFVG